jgi:hypothetical protein
MKFYWMAKDDGSIGNFGDTLSYYILNYYNINYTFTNDWKSNIESICCGSIIKRAKKGVHVFGSGILSRDDKLDPDAIYKFVRGPLTRQRILECGGDCPEIYGDPGMLVKLIKPPVKEKKYKIGYFPHFIDYNNVKNMFPDDLVVNLHTDSSMEILDKISSCDLVVSSSLHGIICAHAYNVPTVWAKSINPLSGDNVKFYDYFQSVNLTIDEPADYFSKEYFSAIHDVGQIDRIFKELKKT